MNNQRQYDREFKINAVKLYRENGKSLVTQASDLGIPMSTLATWVKQFKEDGSKSWFIRQVGFFEHVNEVSEGGNTPYHENHMLGVLTFLFCC